MITAAGNRGGVGSNVENHEGIEGRVENLPPAVLGEQSLAVDMARAEIDQAIATAHRYPRQLDTVIKKIGTLACYNDAAAENCIYSLPRGGKPIIGASIGFANIVASSWGNCTDGARIVHIDRHEKTIVAEGGFHDLETNRKTIVPVQRRIVDRQGRLFSDDMIMVTGMAAASIARRNAILNAVPRALWFPIYEQALQIVRGTVETFGERKAKAIQAFSQFGVKPEQIYMALGIKGDADLTLEHIAPMRGMYQALRDGSTTVEEMFDPRRMTGTAFEKVENPLGEEVVDPKTGEIKAKPKRGRPVKKAQPVIEPPNPTAAALVEIAKQQAASDPLPPAQALKSVEIVNPGSGYTVAPAGPPPRNVSEYHRYARAWLADVKDAAELERRWQSEKDLRGRCSVIGEDLDTIFELKLTRAKQLNPTAV